MNTSAATQLRFGRDAARDAAARARWRRGEQRLDALPQFIALPQFTGRSRSPRLVMPGSIQRHLGPFKPSTDRSGMSC
jgi:hypothetical protein